MQEQLSEGDGTLSGGGAQGVLQAKPGLLWLMLGMLQSYWRVRKGRTAMESRSNMFPALKRLNSN